MPMVLLTLDWPGRPQLDEVARALGLRRKEIDARFGVVALDRAGGHYAIRVTAAAAARCRGRPEVVGLHADARLAPFGPPAPGAEGGSGDG